MAGSLYLRFTTGAVQATSANQWAPTLTYHDPNPALSIEDQPVAQYDWPNPRVPAVHVSRLTHIQDIATRDDTTRVLRPPLITRIAPRSSAVALLAFAPNLLLSTLALTQGTPFSQTDWPRAAPRRTAVELLTWVGQNLPLLAPPAAAAPLVPVVLENPRATPRAPVDVLRANMALLSAPAPAAPPTPVFWDNPRPAPRRPVPYHHRSDVDPATPPPAGTPFAQYDWPPPRRSPIFVDVSTLGGVLIEQLPPLQALLTNPRAVRRPPDWFSVNLLLNTLSLPPGTPLRPVDLSVPRRRPQDVTRLTWIDSLKLPGQAPPVMPPAPGAWPNPVRRAHDVARLTWIDSLKLPAYAAPIMPPSSGDWPNPRPRRRLLEYTVAPNLLQTTLAPSAPAAVYGWGARSKIGGTPARDLSQSIGGTPARDLWKSIGDTTAKAKKGEIGGDE